MSKKKTKIIFTVIGAIGTIVGSVLLPIGCLKTVSFYGADDVNIFLGTKVANEDAEIKIGVGSSNYGEFKKVIIDGEDRTSSYEIFNILNKVSYSEFIDNIENEKDRLPYLHSNGLIGRDEYNLLLRYYYAAIEGNDLRSWGIGILVVFGLILVISTYVLYKNKKQVKKSNKDANVNQDNLTFESTKTTNDDF